ncbi:hypothetical protein GDO86_015557 [Hymenochirus boettgeri]|uniref:Butyrophilin subfamily 1 member A1-like n=1 Tax=Hymenochirus boettgeri TaxID=247094 RepID=A0A8T2JTE2_9PIPI|nr:hypothetical protein GDO86_015557 [Hymenochirus boettgeri]
MGLSPLHLPFLLPVLTLLEGSGIGSPPLVKVSLQGSSVLLSCSSSDWFPEPKMNWKSEDGTLNYTGVMESHTQSDGLVSISSNIIIEDSSKGSLYCDIKHPVNGKETGVYVIVSESLFPVISTWTILLSLLLVLSLVVITVIAWKFHLYCKEKERQLNAKETILNLQKQEIEWRKAAVHKESILFDPLTAYRNLIISPDYCVITTAGHEQNATPNEKRFDTEPCVLAQYSYNSGKHYWETEIQERGSQFWSLGIAKESIRRSGGQRESPEAGIWVIRASTDGFFGLSSPPNKILPSQRPNIVGILLNYEDGSLSFYNANTYELLFQFVDISIAEEPVFPFYYIGDGITFVLNPLK